MIRRAFWLSVGAAAGIAGYRRATAVGRAVQVRVTGERPESDPGPFWPPRSPTQPSAPMPPREILKTSRRPGSAAARRSPRPAPFSATRTAWRTSRAAWRAQKAAVAGVRSAGRFARDVRAGMDLYTDRQEDQPGSNLAKTTNQ
ncbi:MAG: hypothetical protein JO016_03535 [Actinobacteria bacterium]|nr:hypothetical protein [Actinomycetota bacterium]